MSRGCAGSLMKVRLASYSVPSRKPFSHSRTACLKCTREARPPLSAAAGFQGEACDKGDSGPGTVTRELDEWVAVLLT
jgi:hypothetical protein